MRRVVIVTGAACLLSGTALAHARWKESKLKPRSDSSAIKSGPCGSDPVDEDKRVTLKAGDQVELQWEETINHPGHFRIAFSTDGSAGFDDQVLLDDIPDDQNGGVNYSDPSTYHQFKATVTLPSEPCDSCTLQLIQVMTDKTPPNDKYYSCADVKLTADGATDPSTGSSTGTGTTSGPKPAAPKKLKVQVKKVGDL